MVIEVDDAQFELKPGSSFSRPKAWSLRLLVFAGIAVLCFLAGSANPAIAFALTWGPNYPILGAVMIGALRLPRALEPVHSMEPKFYRWAGVGLIRRIVTSHAWLGLVGLPPPQKATSRNAILDRSELLTMGAEICHLAALGFASCFTLLFFAVGLASLAAWILAFNVVLNGYPIMLQRSNRWRVRHIRVTRTRMEGRI